MTPERFARLKEILLALEELPAAEVAAYLDRLQVEDAGLRPEIEALLGQPDASLGLQNLASAVNTGTALAPPRGSSVPERIGPYRLLGVLGEGGMGTVYRAEQLEPIRREVALKLVRPGLDSRQIATRFEAERQTLAMMDHPNIARVLDAGAAADGSPYFVMELVLGMPVTEYCRSHRLRQRARLQILRTIARAVEHAHQKGIIHRDLKPSNLLVEARHGDPIPKVIDFGIAKAMEPVAGSPLTNDGQLLGTLEYMSPEQARGLPGSVDTRSDVYALGVVLYELVAGELPRRTPGAPIHEMLRAIAEDPVPPLRRTATHESLDRDVETIVMKALAPDPEQRYSSAGALADDLDRFLRSEPITARAPSRSYQLRKLVARHRAAFAGLTTTIALLLAFGILSSLMLRTQTRERERAEREARKATRTLAFLEEVLGSSTPQTGGSEVTVRQVLDAARETLSASRLSDPEIEVAARLSLAETYISIGHSPEAEEQLRLALDRSGGVNSDADRARVLESLGNAVYYRGGREAEAESLWLQAVGLLRDERGGEERLASLLGSLGVIASKRGDLARAEGLLRESIDRVQQAREPEARNPSAGWSNLALVLERQGRLDEAEAAARESLRFGRRYDGAFGEGHGAGKLGRLLCARGKYAEAEAMLTRAVALLDSIFRNEQHDSREETRFSLGALYLRRGDWEKAERVLLDGLALQQARLRAVQEGKSKQVGAQMRVHLALAESRARQGRLDEAGKTYLRVFELSEQTRPMHNPLVAEGLRGMAEIRRLERSPAAAESLLLASLDLLAGREEHQGAAWSLLALGMLHLEERAAREAEPVLRRCLVELAACGRTEWWPAAVAKNELACALAAQGKSLDEAERLRVESRPALVGPDSPVAFDLRQRALAHTLLELLPAAEQDRSLYSNALERM